MNMTLTLVKGKIHRATVTQADLLYEGSISIDLDLMDAAGILSFERVQVVNANNGERLETYAIPAPKGSGIICLNGPAARKCAPGDIVVIMAYAEMSVKMAETYEPTIVRVNEKNEIKEVFQKSIQFSLDQFKND